MKKSFFFVCLCMLALAMVVSCAEPEEEVKSYTVAFDSNGGSEVSTVVVKEGEKVAKPENPLMDGYGFISWMLDGKLYDFNSAVNSDITLTAKWFSIWDGSSVDTSWYSSEKERFVLTSASQLAGLAKLVNEGASFEGKKVELGIDVDLASKPWTSIGTGERSGKGIAENSNAFSGCFDGCGYYIENLAIVDSGSKDNCVGFFGIIKGGNVTNVTFKNAKVVSDKSSVSGIAVGYAVENSVVDSITIEEGSSITAIEAGGIVGRMTVSGSISDCENHAHVTTKSGGAGGIVGKAYYSEDNKAIRIDNCRNYGVIESSTGGYVGGIAGLFAGEMTSCENSGRVSGNGTSIGGVVGEMTNYGFVRESTNNGEVVCISEKNDNYGLGGIVGWIRYQNNASAYARTGIIEISGNTNNGTISGNSAGVGGVVGMLFNAGCIEDNTSNAASIKGSLFVSGIVGAHQINSENSLSSDAYVSKTTFKNNVSTTRNESIVGISESPCCATIVYLNSSEKIPAENISGNSPENVNL